MLPIRFSLPKLAAGTTRPFQFQHSAPTLTHARARQWGLGGGLLLATLLAVAPAHAQKHYVQERQTW